MKKIFLLLSVAFIVSCGGELKKAVFTRDISSIYQQMSNVSTFSDIQLKSTSYTEFGSDNTDNQLKLILTNGTYLPPTEGGRDTLARHLVTLTKRAVENFRDFNWITVVFEKDDESGQTNFSKKVFVYRIEEFR
jgi:hypothetical protein